MLENTWREFGGVGWPGCGVVDIALVRGGRRQLIAKTKFGAPPGRNQLNTWGIHQKSYSLFKKIYTIYTNGVLRAITNKTHTNPQKYTYLITKGRNTVM
jgi:hypothetical protein